MARAVLLLVIFLTGCDLEPERCDPLAIDCPLRLGINGVDAYTDMVSGGPLFIARGGVATLEVDDKEREGELSLEVTGGEVLEELPRGARVRGLDSALAVHAEIDDLYGDREIPILPVERIELLPTQQQFELAPAAVDFAVVRGARVPAILRLIGGEERLIDQSMVATGPGVAEHGRWDVVVIDGAADPIAISVAGDSGSAELTVPSVPPELDEIVALTGPGLDDPEQPVTLTPDGEALICFTGMTGGVAVAGLEWTLDGPGVYPLDGCALIDRTTTTLTVSAGGISRSFELELVEPF